MAERACSPFLRWRPEALFFKAELLERVGRKEEARRVYENVLSEVCGCAILARAVTGGGGGGSGAVLRDCVGGEYLV